MEQEIQRAISKRLRSNLVSVKSVLYEIEDNPIDYPECTSTIDLLKSNGKEWVPYFKRGISLCCKKTMVRHTTGRGGKRKCSVWRVI